MKVYMFISCHITSLLVFSLSVLLYGWAVLYYDGYLPLFPSYLFNSPSPPPVRKHASYEVSYFIEPIDFLHDARVYVGRESALARPVHDRGSEAEALATLHAANGFCRNGKFDKAEKLYEHALALQPNHPDILTEYGIFVENYSGDIVKANFLYSRALIFRPDHSVAKEYSAKTKPIVAEIDADMMRILDEKRGMFLRIPRGNSALRRAMRESYIAHVYHTVALEGNTMTLMQTRSILETKLAIAGKSVMEHNEILGLDSALRFINSSMTNRIGAITINDILDIHKRVLGYVDPVEAGRFRTTEVFIGKFTPTEPQLVEQEMNEFITWINSESAVEIHPVEMAAIAHYKFVSIHPFIDGNGRTARLLMNFILMQAGFPPVTIRLEDRPEYYDKLILANEGDLRPFVRFIAKCTERTLEEYLRCVTEHKPSTVDTISSVARDLHRIHFTNIPDR
ncbi:unnamed protein product [Soboliphyme baturini]|uniref:protein adenylyltransferase n=1 Tax=Soboliphyme baturini TaxID=241478 RepID=A0A183I8Z9_9BILA|nr:unnamed protein product [Soboliphyme baturini]